jgi:hypothetical protein
MHFQNDFSFVAQAPMGVTAPLFGANRERVWAPDWNPVFLWPRDVADQPGMVFTVDHGDNIAVWVNTVFDLAAGRVQYVYVLPDVVATVISLQLVPIPAFPSGTSARRCASPRRRADARPGRVYVRHWISIGPRPMSTTLKPSIRSITRTRCWNTRSQASASAVDPTYKLHAPGSRATSASSSGESSVTVIFGSPNTS